MLPAVCRAVTTQRITQPLGKEVTPVMTTKTQVLPKEAMRKVGAVVIQTQAILPMLKAGKAEVAMPTLTRKAVMQMRKAAIVMPVIRQTARLTILIRQPAAQAVIAVHLVTAAQVPVTITKTAIQELTAIIIVTNKIRGRRRIRHLRIIIAVVRQVIQLCRQQLRHQENHRLIRL